VRETVVVPGATSSEDGDEIDELMVDIIRPAASDGDLDVPTIIIPSPYYQSPGRGRLGETKPSPSAEPSLVVDGQAYATPPMTGSIAVDGESGNLVDCGLGLAVDDCPDDTDGAIALIERGGETFANKATNAVAAGAVAVVVYNNQAGSYTGTLGGSSVPVPVLSMSGTDGQALVGQLADGELTGTLDEVQPDIDFFPLYYDNYFVPRGYAVALVDLAGTRGSTGCIDIGGPAEIDNTVKVVEWLNNAEGSLAYDIEGNEVAADWSNGSSAMLGKSWDGTVANGVAATGVEGLRTIIPITAISSWHKYYWSNGAGYAGSPLGLANNIRNVPADRCQETNAELAQGGADPDPTTDFWMERDYIPDADQVEASVFIVHGTNDYNVKPHNYAKWWDALAENDVPRKIWLSEVAHEKAFDFRRDDWMVTANRWFDHWLYDIDNGIMDEPVADVEHGPDQWSTYDQWPGGSNVTLHLSQPDGDSDPRPGALQQGRPNWDPGIQTFDETRQSANNASIDGLDDRDDRLAFLTPELTEPLRVSGTPTVSIKASFDDPTAMISAYLVDYGEAERTQHPFQGGIQDLATETCFGQGTVIDTGCYPDVQRRTTTQDFAVIARGWADAGFLAGESEFDPEETYRLEWEIFADDYVFEAGHRLGIVISGSDTTVRDPYPAASRGEVTIELNGSHVQLPVEGGTRAFREATGTQPGSRGAPGGGGPGGRG
jgi:X-Pro dipeptidyl-peptidase